MWPKSATNMSVIQTLICVRVNVRDVRKQPIRKALKTPELVLSEAIYFRTKSFEVPDMLKGVVRTSDKNLPFPTTLAVLMSIFYKLVLYECRNKMAMITNREKMKVLHKKPEFQTKLRYTKRHYGKATSRLVGHV